MDRALENYPFDFENGNGTTLTAYDWIHKVGLLDSQLSDPANFDLSDSSASIVAAVFTGLSMLLLYDVVLRVVVRAKSDTVSTHGVVRFHLANRFINPLSWFVPQNRGGRTRIANQDPKLPVSEQLQEAEISSDFKQSRSQNTHRGFPKWQAVMIAVVCVLVTGVELLLLYMSSSSAVAVNIDKTRVPSFQFEPLSNNSLIIRQRSPLCTTTPSVTKEAFVSKMQIIVCSENKDLEGDPIEMPEGIATVAVRLLDIRAKQIRFTIFTDRYMRTLQQEVWIDLDHAAIFETKANTSIEQITTVIPKVFSNHKINGVDTSITEKSANPIDWEFNGYLFTAIKHINEQ